VRHAHAARIAVLLGYGADSVALEVRDDGCGFDPERVLAGGRGHFGLRGLRGRAEKIGGTLRIDSRPGAGTAIKIVVPRPGSGSSNSHAS